MKVLLRSLLFLVIWFVFTEMIAGSAAVWFADVIPDAYIQSAVVFLFPALAVIVLFIADVVRLIRKKFIPLSFFNRLWLAGSLASESYYMAGEFRSRTDPFLFFRFLADDKLTIRGQCENGQEERFRTEHFILNTIEHICLLIAIFWIVQEYFLRTFFFVCSYYFMYTVYLIVRQRKKRKRVPVKTANAKGEDAFDPLHKEPPSIWVKIRSFFHVLNIILCVGMLICVLAMIPHLLQSFSDDYNLFIAFHMTFTLIIAIGSIYGGVFLPKDVEYEGEAQPNEQELYRELHQKGEFRSANSIQNMIASGSLTPRRQWSPAVTILLFFFQLIGVFTAWIGSTPDNWMIVLPASLTIVLFFTSYLWKVADNKERLGNFLFLREMIPIMVTAAFIMIPCIIGILGSNRKLQQAPWYGLIYTNEIQEELEIIEAARDIPPESIAPDDVKEDIKQYFDETDGTLYYKILVKDDIITYVVWTENGDDVFIHQYRKTGDQIIPVLSMKSDSMKKSDVEGKEDGTL